MVEKTRSGQGWRLASNDLPNFHVNFPFVRLSVPTLRFTRGSHHVHLAGPQVVMQF